MTRALPLALLVILATAARAHAHPLGFAVITVHEQTAGEAEIVVRISGTESDPGQIALGWPADCDERVTRDAMDDEVRERRSTLRCASPLAGRTLHVEGPARGLEVRLETALLDRAPASIGVRSLPADVSLGSATDVPRLLRQQARLGALHFAGGIDHVLFVVGAFFLARKRGPRAVALAVTAFTIGHAITLALATFGAWTIPTRPVEACIALSLVHVARELRVEQDTLTRRAPAIACAAFGLVHGAGLASAMSDAGLGGADLGIAVGAFNVGLELAELGLVLALFVLARGPILRFAERAAPLAIGGVGAWLLLDRLL